MMREIKFRKPQYINSEFLGFDYWGYGIKNDGGKTKNPDIFTEPLNFMGISYKPDEQYTDRKDKNDKEIYEGDVDKQYGEIVFIDGCFKFKQSIGNDEYYYRRLNEAWSIEIIGNIHEDTS